MRIFTLGFAGVHGLLESLEVQVEFSLKVVFHEHTIGLHLRVVWKTKKIVIRIRMIFEDSYD